MSKQTYNENGFTYTVDDNGTITAGGKIESDNGVKCGARVTPDGMKDGDQRGHVIAASEGGVNKDFNMTAQNGKLNQGAYKSVEQAEVNLAKQGYDVNTSKTAYVSNQQEGRPDAYMINDTLTAPNGKTQDIHLSFQNMSPQEQQEMNDQSAEIFSEMSSEFSNPGSRPEGMTENEYAQLMEETDMDLPSINDEFDMDNTTSMSFDEGFVSDAQSSFDSGTSNGAESSESGMGADSSAEGGAAPGADGGEPGGLGGDGGELERLKETAPKGRPLFLCSYSQSSTTSRRWMGLTWFRTSSSTSSSIRGTLMVILGTAARSPEERAVIWTP